ncbi:MAG: hypothetical protein JNL68_04440 [Burkholderiales bacterium]|nr:hypothetical protein [Burkholderiales bacterium]
MLALPILTPSGLIAIDDDSIPDRVYVALARPRVARRSDGSSRVRLVRWTRQSGSADPAAVGARLTLDVEIQPTADEIAAAGLAGRDVQPLPWADASVRLEGPQFDPVVAPVAVALGTVAAVTVDLPALAAGILAPLLQAAAVSPLQVTWSGHVPLRLPPAEVIATADVAELRRRIRIVDGERELTITRSLIDANAHIEIRGVANPDLERALRDWVLDELAARFREGRSMSVHAAASDIVRWPILLATTLDDFVPAATRGGLVETLILTDDEIGRAPAIEVRALASFGDRLERVDVQIERMAGGAAVELALTDAAPRVVPLGTLDFRWRHRAKLAGLPSGDWSSWQDSRGVSGLLIPVSVPRALEIEVLAAGLDFARRWASVRVVLEHTPPGGPATSQAVELDAARPGARWTQPLDGVRGPVRAHATFVSRQGRIVEQSLGDVANDQVIVTDPLDRHRVRVALVASGSGWNEVALAMVDLRYVDGTYTVDETVELRTTTDFVEWEAPARADGPQSVQWRCHASFRDGRFESGAWQTAAPGVVLVRIDGVPRRRVQVLPVFFDTSATRQGVVRLRSGSQVETVVISDRTQRTVTLGPGPFTWTVAWTAADGTELPESAPQSGDDVIVLPAFRGA